MKPTAATTTRTLYTVVLTATERDIAMAFDGFAASFGGDGLKRVDSMYAKGDTRLAWGSSGFGGQRTIYFPDYDLMIAFTGWNTLPNRPSLTPRMSIDRGPSSGDAGNGGSDSRGVFGTARHATRSPPFGESIPTTASSSIPAMSPSERSTSSG